MQKLVSKIVNSIYYTWEKYCWFVSWWMLLIQGICHKFDEVLFLESHALVDLHCQKAPTANNNNNKV